MANAGDQEFVFNAVGDFTCAVHSKNHKKCERIVLQAQERGLRGAFFEAVNHDPDVVFKAAQAGEPATLDLLHRNNVSFERTDSDGNTALHRAAEMGHLPVVMALVKHSANLGLLNNKGQTPLQRAKKKNKRDVVRYLSTCSDVLEEDSFVTRSSLTWSRSSTPFTMASVPSMSHRDASTGICRNSSSNGRPSGFAYKSDEGLNGQSVASSELDATEAASDAATSDVMDKELLDKLSREREEHRNTKRVLSSTLQHVNELEEEAEQAAKEKAASDSKLATLTSKLIEISMMSAGPSAWQALRRLLEVPADQLGRLTSVRSSLDGTLWSSRWRGCPIWIKDTGIPEATLERASDDVIAHLQQVLLVRHPRVLSVMGFCLLEMHGTSTLALILERAPCETFRTTLTSTAAAERLLVDLSGDGSRIRVMEDLAAALQFFHIIDVPFYRVHALSIWFWPDGHVKILPPLHALLQRLDVPSSASNSRRASANNLFKSSNAEVARPEYALARDVHQLGLLFLMLWTEQPHSDHTNSNNVLLGAVLEDEDDEGGDSGEDEVNGNTSLYNQSSTSSSASRHEEACRRVSNPNARLLISIMLNDNPACRPSMQSVLHVLAALRTQRGSLMTVDQVKSFLNGPHDADWKPPLDLQPLSDDPWFHTQIKCLPMDSSEEAIRLFKLRTDHLSAEVVRATLLLKPDAEVGFFGQILHEAAKMRYGNRCQPELSTQGQALIDRFYREARLLERCASARDIACVRVFMPFASVKAANKVLLGELTRTNSLRSSDSSDAVPGALFFLEERAAVNASLGLSQSNSATLLVCDAIVSNLCVTSTANSFDPVVTTHQDDLRLLVRQESHVLPRALIAIDFSSLV
ncbi:uncharacterized protein MONBRDRAFT_5952 [Monosiga brevicollis MX1]|uniref:Uncharacterized protein n=1 Tax=Monosiga brevicollis TaxID=81824 RepID=A9UR55_MONBE|nr:uncharacterized protein MONBRDRAFT_5952 [Monosiga brevicollis MX1]EDQ92189.1 predicted protein [Monosiga brevicollis MX1]|eukprot:XP_001743475.1 hypothetical protein [Monosiga brevicollis MX1]